MEIKSFLNELEEITNSSNQSQKTGALLIRLKSYVWSKGYGHDLYRDCPSNHQITAIDMALRSANGLAQEQTLMTNQIPTEHDLVNIFNQKIATLISPKTSELMNQLRDFQNKTRHKLTFIEYVIFPSSDVTQQIMDPSSDVTQQIMEKLDDTFNVDTFDQEVLESTPSHKEVFESISEEVCK